MKYHVPILQKYIINTRSFLYHDLLLLGTTRIAQRLTIRYSKRSGHAYFLQSHREVLLLLDTTPVSKRVWQFFDTSPNKKWGLFPFFLNLGSLISLLLTQKKWLTLYDFKARSQKAMQFQSGSFRMLAPGESQESCNRSDCPETTRLADSAAQLPGSSWHQPVTVGGTPLGPWAKSSLQKAPQGNIWLHLHEKP